MSRAATATELYLLIRCHRAPTTSMCIQTWTIAHEIHDAIVSKAVHNKKVSKALADIDVINVEMKI